MFQTLTLYRSIIGALQYVTIPETSLTVGIGPNPSLQNWLVS